MCWRCIGHDQPFGIRGNRSVISPCVRDAKYCRDITCYKIEHLNITDDYVVFPRTTEINQFPCEIQMSPGNWYMDGWEQGVWRCGRNSISLWRWGYLDRLINFFRATGNHHSENKEQSQKMSLYHGWHLDHAIVYFGANVRIKFTRFQRSVSESADLKAGIREPGNPFVIHSKS